MGFRENIVKFQACPIISQVENKDLQDLYGKIKSLLPLELIAQPYKIMHLGRSKEFNEGYILQ